MTTLHSVKPTIAWVRDLPEQLCVLDLPDTRERQIAHLEQVERWLTILDSIPDMSQWHPVDILQAADVQQVRALCEAIKMRTEPLPSAQAVMQHARSAAGSTFANLWRGFRQLQLKSIGVSYREMVRDVAKSEDVDVEAPEPDSAIEDKIIRNRFVRYMENLSEEDREKLMEQMKAVADEYGRSFMKEAAAGGTLALAELSGFGVYVLASTIVGAISNALGLGLTFGFYVAMSQAISLLIPGGFAAVGGWTVYKITKPNLQKTTAAVLHIATMRLYAADLLAQKVELLEKRKMHLARELGPEFQNSKGQGAKRSWWRRLFG